MIEPGSNADDEFSTDWQQINQAKDPTNPEGKAALDALLERYAPTIKSYLATRFRFDCHQVDDLFQSFVERKILKGRWLTRANPARGRFRSFLLGAVHNFALSEIRRENSEKRGAGYRLVNLDEVPESAFAADHPAHGDEIDVMWAQAVIAGALLDMHNELSEMGRQDVWELFSARVIWPLLLDEPPLDYTTLIDRFCFDSPAQALNTLVTAKRMFRRHLRAVVVQYIGNGALAEDEICRLQRILSRHRKP